MKKFFKSFLYNLIRDPSPLVCVLVISLWLFSSVNFDSLDPAILERYMDLSNPYVCLTVAASMYVSFFLWAFVSSIWLIGYSLVRLFFELRDAKRELDLEG